MKHRTVIVEQPFLGGEPAKGISYLTPEDDWDSGFAIWTSAPDRIGDITLVIRATKEVNPMLRLNHLLVALVVAMLAVAATGAASAAPPPPTPGAASCPGLDTASFAQDWKSFSFEPPGVAPLVKFYGGTSPTDFTQSARYEDCATP